MDNFSTLIWWKVRSKAQSEVHPELGWNSVRTHLWFGWEKQFDLSLLILFVPFLLCAPTNLFIDFVPLTKPAPKQPPLRLLWISNYIQGLMSAKKWSWCHGCPHSLSTWDRDCWIGDIKMSHFTLFLTFV
jgi:hypothetical protein